MTMRQVATKSPRSGEICRHVVEELVDREAARDHARAVDVIDGDLDVVAGGLPAGGGGSRFPPRVLFPPPWFPLHTPKPPGPFWGGVFFPLFFHNPLVFFGLG